MIVNKPLFSIRAASTSTNPWATFYNYFQTIAGVLVLATIFRDFIEWKHLFIDIINAWTTLSRPIATYLFGWVFALLEWPLSNWLKDYLVVSAIMSGAHVRYLYSAHREVPRMSREWFRPLLIAHSIEQGIQLDDESIIKAERHALNSFLSEFALLRGYLIASKRHGVLRHAGIVPAWVVGVFLWPLNAVLAVSLRS